MFQGPEIDVAKPSSRVLKPPGGCSSNVFGSPEEVSVPLRPHKMTSNIFGGGEEPQAFAKKTNPPGGKESGIFEDHKPNASRQLANPPGGKTSNIFGSPQPFSTVKAHPNKPKDHTVILDDRGDSRQELKTKATEDQKRHVEVVKEMGEAPKVVKEMGEAPKESTKMPGPKMDDHEPRLGPRPRSHNKVLNPPGGKSSIAFY